MYAPKNKGGLGFKSVHNFNLVMLFKQAWGFIIKPNSLVTKLFKARYFLNCEFLKAKLGSNPSFVWSSLYATRDCLRQGARWWIGDALQCVMEGTLGCLVILVV